MNTALILSLRQKLHNTPEASGNESRTKELLQRFLREHTSCEILDFGAYFVALHKESAAKKRILFRADMDAICDSHGNPFHGCGHDGHCAALCSLALELESCHVGNDVYFLFQPAEENGQGAKICEGFLLDNAIDRVYGFHNLPGFPQGEIIVKRGTFAYASAGLRITFLGRQAHAAQPETGLNPAFAIAEIISSLEQARLSALTATGFNTSENEVGALCTVISVSVGTPNAFGVSAGTGVLELTVRAFSEHCLELLIQSITAAGSGVPHSVERFDVFPDTANADSDFDEAINALKKAHLTVSEITVPFRWSEDFGRYLKSTRGMFFGIGASSKPLHTEDYEFDDAILPCALAAFTALSTI